MEETYLVENSCEIGDGIIGWQSLRVYGIFKKHEVEPTNFEGEKIPLMLRAS